MAYVFIQHLSPNHESALPEILEKSAKIPVHQITDNIHLEQDNFYIIPANKIVTAVDGILKLAALDDKRHKVKVIDLFFSSIAVVHQSFAVGVVLSGTLNDGTLGLQVIKSHGGITFAQDEASAAFDGMPKSAIDTGAVDFVLPPEKIAEHLMTINHPFHQNYSKKEIAKTIPEKDEEVFKQLLTVLRVRRGVDFTYYKPSTLKRRIIRRMALNQIEKPAEYLSYLRENKPEQDALYNDMLISVTNFFRDAASFDLLCNIVFPKLIKQKSENESLRIWVAGCATGEEAYSMAICLQEHLGDKATAMKIQIFATDISETAIAKARTGIYRANDLEGLSSSRQQQFFTKLDGNYQVNKTVRDMCVFAQHNLLKDPPFSKMDLISCRNVLIYLEPVLQNRALTTFHYALNDHGFLMLGKSESIGKSAALFSPYNNHEKIFRRQGTRGRFMHVASHGSEQNFKNIDKNFQKEHDKPDVFKMADDFILAKHAPPGVLINEQFDIIQFRGATIAWITPSPGKASLNLLRMAHDDLSFELRNLLHLAKRTNSTARKEGVGYRADTQQQYVNLEVSPLEGDNLHYLVLFEKVPISIKPATKARTPVKIGAIDQRDIEIEQLKKELAQARIDMRTVTEEQEAVNEELQSANQELLSSSEELQSLNEELETSKEELQSTNEEISIVNNELIDRNEQLNNARAYAEGIINTIRDPLIILDKELRVKRATDGFYTKFNVTEKETEGQYFYKLGNHQWNIPDLLTRLENVINEKTAFSGFEVAHVFPDIGRKVMYLNACQLPKVHGEQVILLAIEDITDKRKVEEGLAEVEKLFKESRERLKLAVDAAELGTWDFNPLTKELILDDRCKALFGFSSFQEMDLNQYLDVIHPDDRDQLGETTKEALSGTTTNGEFEEEFRVIDRNKKQKWIKSKGKVYFNDEGIAARFVGTSLDITDQKTHDEAIKELLAQKDDFISIASHELKTPITTLKASIQLIHRMKDNPSPHKLPGLIETASKNLDKVNVLVEGLLNVSQLKHGQLYLNKKQFILSEEIKQCYDHIHAEGVYRIIMEGDLKIQVFADPERVDQVVINFINNAIKYAPESKEIKINIEKTEGMAKVSIIDKGPGISSENLSLVFERHYRIDTRGSRSSGLGLGLYICGEIIKKHGGQIGVDSEIDKGSTFWFTIPLNSE